MTNHEKEFYSTVLGEPYSVDDAQRELDRLVEEYHEETEAFDQMICTGRTENGTAVPVNGRELRTINANDRELRSRLRLKAERLGFTLKEVHASMVAAARSTRT